MIDPILFYVGVLTALFFFWVYGVVSFVRDVKTELVPWFRGRSKAERDERTDGERRSY